MPPSVFGFSTDKQNKGKSQKSEKSKTKESKKQAKKTEASAVFGDGDDDTQNGFIGGWWDFLLATLHKLNLLFLTAKYTKYTKFLSVY